MLDSSIESKLYEQLVDEYRSADVSLLDREVYQGTYIEILLNMIEVHKRAEN